MSEKIKSLRSPLAKARGLGSAKSGTEHWLAQRMTALALIPLMIYVLVSFFDQAVFGGYNGAITWLHAPVAATLVVLTLLISLRHGVLGLQIIIEDYTHHEGLKILSLLVVKFLAAALAILGSLSVAKIFFGA